MTSVKRVTQSIPCHDLWFAPDPSLVDSCDGAVADGMRKSAVGLVALLDAPHRASVCARGARVQSLCRRHADPGRTCARGSSVPGKISTHGTPTSRRSDPREGRWLPASSRARRRAAGRLRPVGISWRSSGGIRVTGRRSPRAVRSPSAGISSSSAGLTADVIEGSSRTSFSPAASARSSSPVVVTLHPRITTADRRPLRKAAAHLAPRGRIPSTNDRATAHPTLIHLARFRGRSPLRCGLIRAATPVSE